jgi:Cu/Ag efflux protein CusF
MPKKLSALSALTALSALSLMFALAAFVPGAFAQSPGGAHSHGGPPQAPQGGHTPGGKDLAHRPLAGPQASQEIGGVFEGRGEVKAVDAPARRVVIDHGPIPAINWGAMTMAFQVADASILEGVSSGDRVTFDLKVGRPAEGPPADYVIVGMEVD